MRNRFPRRFRRGLIEAPHWRRTCPMPACDFRGDSAAASLKQLSNRRQPSMGGDFRGDSAAASLKRGCHPVHLRRSHRFPRRFRRGLIEARPVSCG